MIDSPLKPMLYDNPVLDYNYKDWSTSHIWLHKQPLPLWTIAGSLYCFGINEIAVRIPSILLSTLGIWIMFLIGKKLYNDKVGYIAAFLYSIHGLIIELSAGRVATDHIDIFFLFFIQLAVLFILKFKKRKSWIYNVLCGISIGFAILSKWLPALIVLPIWLLLLYQSKQFKIKQLALNFFLLCFVILFIALPWQVYIHQVFPKIAEWESQFNIKHFTEVLEDHEGPFYYYLIKWRLLFGELIYLAIGWFLWAIIKRPVNFKHLSLLIWFIIPVVFFSFAKTKMQGYILFTAPAIFIITGLFCYYLYFKKNTLTKWGSYFAIFLLLGLPVRYSIERIKPFEKREREPLWAKRIKQIDCPDNTVIFNIERPIETMFYHDCIAYSKLPNISTLKRLKNEGYSIALYEGKGLVKKYKTLPFVQIIK